MNQPEPSNIFKKEEVNREPVYFVAGQMRLLLENGCIRWIRLGNTEIVRMIYLAVRDHNWGTLDYTMENFISWKSNDHFRVTFTMLFGQPTVFEADCSITGHADNTIQFRFEGIMLADFKSNRIGFCVLHPILECKGLPCKIVHTNGSVEKGRFPGEISPHQPFKDIKNIRWAPNGITAELNFAGDVFEMEDQRNWTDASFKTYCTPLENPFPVLRKKGTFIEQAVELKVEQTDLTENNAADSQIIKIKIDPESLKPIPTIGVWYNPQNGALSNENIKLFQKTCIQHLRFDINFGDKNWPNHLEQFLTDWRKWKIDVELTFHVKSDDYRDFVLVLNELSELKLQLKYIQFFSAGSKSTRIEEVADFVQLCRETFPESKIGAGTDYDFTDINRYRFNAELFDYIVYSICPQVHAFDNFSLIENLAAQPETVESTKAIYPGKLVHTSVISLLRRSNPDATIADVEHQLNNEGDLRQHRIFGAQWGTGALKYLIESNLELITIFETHGKRGLLFSEEACDLKLKQSPFALVLERIVQFQPEFILQSKSELPLLVEVMALKRTNHFLLILINYSIQQQTVKLLPHLQPTQCITLTEQNINFNYDFCLKEMDTRNLIVEGILILKPGSITILEKLY